MRALLMGAGYQVHDHQFSSGYGPCGFVAMGDDCLVLGLDAGSSYPAVWQIFPRRGPTILLAEGHTDEELSRALGRLSLEAADD